MKVKENRLNYLRTKESKSLVKLSTELKEKYGMSITPSQLNYYEKGERLPRNEEVWEKLADHFGVSVAYLLGYDAVEFGKVFLPQTSEDFSEVLEIGKNRLVDILGANSKIFIENNLQNNESVGIPDKVNLLIAIGLLPLDYADVVLHYSILTEEKAEAIRELIKVSIPDPVKESKQLHQQISKTAGSMAVWGDDTNKIQDLGKRIEDALKDNNEEPKS
ncbi:TPA: helix-turn-helix transcriptional regulator [Streptococcus suis]|nr:helix-turn-helix transcriptional regulator [Streptococcus suis]HEL2259200.1 helix-turn-helix transcriptional regulator [Streptococcus suis]HEM5158610.1 helix-turn-helix transcriptional regulator [Streptococcus suis]